jgi:hypothetical protein
MSAFILLFKNFDKTDITLDFEVLPEKREIFDGKLIELNDGECVIVCRSFVELNVGKFYEQYRLTNVNDVIKEEMIDSFLMKM